MSGGFQTHRDDSSYRLEFFVQLVKARAVIGNGERGLQDLTFLIHQGNSMFELGYIDSTIYHEAPS
jgi:hypothetical protein